MNWEPAFYPFGFENGLNLRGLNVLASPPDRVRWVSSVRGANGNPGTFKRPKATIENALNNAEANDLILVDPAHAETLTTAGHWTCDVAGVEVVGLGRQGRRPRILMDAAAVTIAVTAAGVCFRNMQFRAGFADVVTCFDVDAESFGLVGCEFVDQAVNENFLALITSGSATDNVCDYMHLIQNRWNSPDAACTNFLAHTGHLDHAVVAGNVVILPGGTASQIIASTAGDLFRGISVLWNFLQTAMVDGDLLFISNDGSTNSGVIAHNRVGHADVTGAHDLGIDALGCRLFDNLSVSTASLSGLLLPAADVDL